MPSIRTLLAALLLALSADAGIVYRFTDGPGSSTGGRVWIDGDRKRVELDPTAGPRTWDVSITTGGKTTYINLQNKTYFHDEEAAAAVPGLGTSRLFHLPIVAEDRIKGQPKLAFEDAGAGPPLGEHATAWHVITIAYRVHGKTQGETLQADVNANASVLIAPTLPRDRDLPMRTGFAAIDGELDEFFASHQGMIVSYELTISRRLKNAPVWTEKHAWTIKELKTTDVDQSLFSIPRGLTYQEPVIGAPGVSSRPQALQTW